MVKDIKVENIYIVCGHTDMRKSISGLAEIIQQQFDLDLFSDSLFLFCGRRRNRLKALIWEEDGFVLLYKRLEDGRYSWPKDENEVRNLTHKQFVWLMQGLAIDQPKAIKKIEGNLIYTLNSVYEVKELSESQDKFVANFFKENKLSDYSGRRLQA